MCASKTKLGGFPKLFQDKSFISVCDYAILLFDTSEAPNILFSVQLPFDPQHIWVGIDSNNQSI